MAAQVEREHSPTAAAVSGVVQVVVEDDDITRLRFQCGGGNVMARHTKVFCGAIDFSDALYLVAADGMATGNDVQAAGLTNNPWSYQLSECQPVSPT